MPGPESIPERSEVSCDDVLSRPFGDIQEEFEIMKAEELTAQEFSDMAEMAQISEGIVFRDPGLKLGIHGDATFFVLVGLVRDLDVPFRGEGDSMPSESRREHAIEHVDSSKNPLDEVLGSSEPHKIVRFLCREGWSDHVEDADKILFRLSDAQPPESDSWSIQTAEELSGLLPQVFIDHSLDDGEKRLRMESTLLAA